ncbi:homeobox protein ceh-10 [Hydra vulgaris]|uniref:Homeobox protein ceh-10 n=1 Tax=Hydra vulgaris TaxID=6087 RepID=A0ABM4CL33_HYDVU
MESQSSKLSFSIERILTTPSTKKHELTRTTHGIFLLKPCEMFFYPSDAVQKPIISCSKNERYKLPYRKKEIKFCKMMSKKVFLDEKDRLSLSQKAIIRQHPTPEKIKGQPILCQSGYLRSSLEGSNISYCKVTSNLDDVSNLIENNKRNRTIFSKKQSCVLEDVFKKTHYPDLKCRYEISQQTKLAENRIQVWFQNRRAKWRRTEKVWGEGSIMAKYGLYGAMVRHSLK